MIHTIRQRIPARNSILLRVGVLAGLMVGLLGIGLMSTRWSPEMVLGLVLAAIGAPPIVILALERLEYGVLAIVATAAFVRFTVPTGTESRIVASLLVTILFIMLWLIRMLTKEKRLYLKPSRINFPLLAFMLATVIAYIWGNAFRDPMVVVWGSWTIVQLGGLGVMLLLPGALLLTVNTISQVRWLELICWLMISIGLLSLAGRFLPLPLSFLNTGGLFSLCFVSLILGQALFNTRLSLPLRLALLGAAGLWMYIQLIGQVTWLSGWLPPLVAIVTLSFLKSKKLFIIFVLAAVVYLGLNWDYYVNTVLLAESEESGGTRQDAWMHNWKVTGKHILFGTGPVGYAAYYMSYFPSEAMATHNNYIDIIAQTGIVGLFFCLWFFGVLGRIGYKLCQRLQGTGDFSQGWANATLACWVGCMVALGLGDWMFPFVYTQTIAGFDYAVYSWILLGGIVVLDNIDAGKAIGVHND